MADIVIGKARAFDGAAGFANDRVVGTSVAFAVTLVFPVVFSFVVAFVFVFVVAFAVAFAVAVVFTVFCCGAGIFIPGIISAWRAWPCPAASSRVQARRGVGQPRRSR